MKRLILVLFCLCLLSTTAFAGIEEVRELYRNKDYTTCIFEAGKVIADENTPTIIKADAQIYIGRCYYIQKDFIKAIPELQKVIDNYPAMKRQCADAQYLIGQCYSWQKQFNEAISEFQKVIDTYPAEKRQCATTQYYIGESYRRLGDETRAQEAYIKACLEYAETGSPRSLKLAFNKINAGSLGKEKYLEIIDALILGIKATPENAEFLGMLKSEQEKLK